MRCATEPCPWPLFEQHFFCYFCVMGRAWLHNSAFCFSLGGTAGRLQFDLLSLWVLLQFSRKDDPWQEFRECTLGFSAFCVSHRLQLMFSIFCLGASGQCKSQKTPAISLALKACIHTWTWGSTLVPATASSAGEDASLESSLLTDLPLENIPPLQKFIISYFSKVMV